MGTLLEAIGIVLETYFGFGFLNAYPIGDNLSPCLLQPKIQKLFKISRHIESLDACIKY